MAQAIGVVGVFIAGHDLIDALSQQRQRVMAYPFVMSRVTEELDPGAGQTMAFVKGAQRQQTGVASDLPAGKIGANGLMTVEGEGQLW